MAGAVRVIRFAPWHRRFQIGCIAFFAAAGLALAVWTWPVAGPFFLLLLLSLVGALAWYARLNFRWRLEVSEEALHAPLPKPHTVRWDELAEAAIYRTFMGSVPLRILSLQDNHGTTIRVSIGYLTTADREWLLAELTRRFGKVRSL
jgi:hypothetical protein